MSQRVYQCIIVVWLIIYLGSMVIGIALACGANVTEGCIRTYNIVALSVTFTALLVVICGLLKPEIKRLVAWFNKTHFLTRTDKGEKNE